MGDFGKRVGQVNQVFHIYRAPALGGGFLARCSTCEQVAATLIYLEDDRGLSMYCDGCWEGLVAAVRDFEQGERQRPSDVLIIGRCEYIVDPDGDPVNDPQFCERSATTWGAYGGQYCAEHVQALAERNRP